MKLTIKKILQSLLGIDLYLFLFSLFKIATLRWDRHEGHFTQLLPLLPEDGIVLDVGANIGMMSSLLARRVHKGVIYAYEPAPVNFSALQRVTAFLRLKNVRLFAWAIGSEEGEIEMFMPMTGTIVLHGLSHVAHDPPATGDHASADSDQGYRFRVPCKRLDDIQDFFVSGCRVTALKIDVEGFELSVLEGASHLIQTHHPIIYAEVGSENREQCFAWLRARDYTIKVAEHNTLVAFDAVRHTHYWNFFFIPAPHTAHS